MKPSGLISNVQETFARVLSRFNLCGSVFAHHANKLNQNHQVNQKSSDQTQSQNDAAQVQFEALEPEVMECWIVGPNYTWCRPGRVRN
jgi:hypothetical protein